MAAAGRCLAGIEVPIVGGDKIQWVKVTVPSSSVPSPPHPTPDPQSFGNELSRDAASCHVVPGDPPAYLIWRIHKNLPNVLEVVELFACKEFPEKGLHLVFQDTLFPFAFICKNENQGASASPYLVYVLTVTGVAYLLNLRSPPRYLSGSIVPRNEFVEVDMHSHAQNGSITAVTGTSGCLVTGRQDGSVICYRLGSRDPSAPGFMKELRDDVGIGRLWNLVSRGKGVGPVQDMVITEVDGQKILLVVHLESILRAWDLASHMRILNYSVTSHELAGSTPLRLWTAEDNNDSDQICVAVLHGGAVESDLENITVYTFSLSAGVKISFLPEPSIRCIPLKEGGLIDLKMNSNKLWILKEDESGLYDLLQTDCEVKHICSYCLQEDCIADKLFQSSENALADLIWTNSSIFSSMKERSAYFVSAVFLRRLLQPGVYQNAALRATIVDHKRYLSEHDFESLTVSGLKREIFAVIEGERQRVALNSSSMVHYWKSFCAHYFRYWCQNSSPVGLLVDVSSNIVGLIRKSSISLFRPLESIEQLIYGSSDEFHDLRSSGLILPDNDLDCEILFELLRCMSNISNQLGRAATALYYESLVSPVISSEDVIFHLLKILETGYGPSLPTSIVSQVGTDNAWGKKQAAHKSQRKFSVDMLVSLRALHHRASTWARVLDVIEKYLKYLNPYKSEKKFDSRPVYNINSNLLIQSTTEVARVMFESAFDVLLLLGYLVNISGQVSMTRSNLSWIKVKLIPMIQDILTQWLIIHFVGSTPSAAPSVDDFNSRLSSLHIDSKSDKMWWDGRLGSSDFTLACLLDSPSYFGGQDFQSSTSFPDSSRFIFAIREFSSSILWGRNGKESISPSGATTMLASHLLQHGQYEAAENLFLIIDTYLRKRRPSSNPQSTDGEWSLRLHLLGFCFIVRAHSEFHGVLKEQKVREAVRCFFRAAARDGASRSLQNVSFQAGFVCPGEFATEAAWKLHYYQWAMQIFEQYAMSEAACQFALAALEQVDAVLDQNNVNGHGYLSEPPITIQGRLWANVFKFKLDLRHYRDAYCAIVSNPDEDSKYICLRRFINVLCEHGATKVLCDGTLPFVGLVDKVEQELAWKAERSDISTKQNFYQLLYAFEAYRSNWRRAASFMYHYSVRLRKEVVLYEDPHISSTLQERLRALSIAINALQLVDPAHAWIDSQPENCFSSDQDSPNKRARKLLADSTALNDAPQSWRQHFHVDIETLEKEYVLTSAQYLNALSNSKSRYPGDQALANWVDILVQDNLYDMAFTIILKFWNGSAVKRELERAFVVMSQKCCPIKVDLSCIGSNLKSQNLLLTSSEDETYGNDKISATLQCRGSNQWETLELYLEKYKKLHPRLPVTVAETLLHTDPHIELPLWLVKMFKGGRRSMPWGMTGQEADPATLFRLYVDYGRHAEATNLLLEYIESLASVRPADIINRKKMSAIWFPYIAIERLWCQLEELQIAGHMVEQCDKLKRLLHEALLSHLKQVKVDSEDAIAAADVDMMQNPSS